MTAKRKQKTAQELEQQRLKRNEKARARHWKKTGVSESTIMWMKNNNML